MSYVINYLHCVWSTRNREPMLLSRSSRYQLYTHIRQYAQSKGIHLDFIGGMPDHIHCIIQLTSDQNLSQIIKNIKGESSHWHNSQGRGRIIWQREYFAVSISPDRLDNVRNYIRNQEKHHAKITFGDEYNNFLNSGSSDSLGSSG